MQFCWYALICGIINALKQKLDAWKNPTLHTHYWHKHRCLPRIIYIHPIPFWPFPGWHCSPYFLSSKPFFNNHWACYHFRPIDPPTLWQRAVHPKPVSQFPSGAIPGDTAHWIASTAILRHPVLVGRTGLDLISHLFWIIPQPLTNGWDKPKYTNFRQRRTNFL